MIPDLKKFNGAKLYLAKIDMPEHQGMVVVIAEGDIDARLRISDWCRKHGFPIPKHHTSMCKEGGECAIMGLEPDEFGVCAVKMEGLAELNRLTGG